MTASFCTQCGTSNPLRPAQQQPNQQPSPHPEHNGLPVAAPAYGQPLYSPPYFGHPVMVTMGPPKSRAAYVLLGLFLGGLGIHNFYAGYTGRAVAQLLIVLLGWWILFIPVLIVWLWVLIEVITVSRDARGIAFQ